MLDEPRSIAAAAPSAMCGDQSDPRRSQTLTTRMQAEWAPCRVSNKLSFFFQHEATRSIEGSDEKRKLAQEAAYPIELSIQKTPQTSIVEARPGGDLTGATSPIFLHTPHFGAELRLLEHSGAGEGAHWP
jgi:hypothetical protein